MATAILITDANGPFGGASAPQLKWSSKDGYSGIRDYRVNTTQESLAMKTVPDAGTSWDADLLQCVVVSKEFRYVARIDEPDGTGGVSIVRVYYAEPSINGHLPPPTSSQRFTILRSGTDTITSYVDIRAILGGVVPADGSSINNGEGFSTKVGTITAQVYVYFPMNSFPDMGRLVRLASRKAVSNGALALPKILGTSVQFAMPAGQVQYEGFSHDVKSGLIEIVHELSLAESFLRPWQMNNKDGNPRIGPLYTVESQIYYTDDLSGLW